MLRCTADELSAGQIHINRLQIYKSQSGSNSTSQDWIQLNYRCVQMCISQRWQSCIYYLWHQDTDSRVCLTFFLALSVFRSVCVFARDWWFSTQSYTCSLVYLFIYLFAAAAAAVVVFALFCIVSVIVCMGESVCIQSQIRFVLLSGQEKEIIV